MSPLVFLNIYESLKSNYVYLEKSSINYPGFGNADTCGETNNKEIKSGMIDVFYGNEIKSKISKPLIQGKGSRVPLDYLKKK